MTLFLSSSPCDDHVPEGVDLPCILNEINGFVEQLAAVWKSESRCLIIAADPDNDALNDEMLDTFAGAFAYHDLTWSEFTICDGRNAENIADLVAESDMILLAGGHVPTEHAFFEQLRLRELLKGYAGVVMGISAGTMNCADEVYAQPEIEGESIDPDYKRFFPGLGLTWVNVLPHYQQVKDYMLDGKRLFEEITYPDSYGRCFIVLVDGSYIMVKDGRTEVFGEAYRIEDGEISCLCAEGCSVVLSEGSSM